MGNVVVLGAGAMGSAFCFPLADSGHAVRLVGTHLDGDWIEAVRSTGTHPKTGISYPDGVVVYSHQQLSEALTGRVDLIVLGVSSPGVLWSAEQLISTVGEAVPVLMLTKGLAADGAGRIRILPDVLRDRLAKGGGGDAPVGAVGGPCIAGELAARRHSCVVIAGRDRACLDGIEALLSAPYYHIWVSADAVGVEVCAALKNLYAIAVGWAQGRLESSGRGDNGSLMHNPAAGLFTQSLTEMSYLARYLGGHAGTVCGLAGAGDLYVTCQAGRNSRLGRLLGTGLGFREAMDKHMKGETVEGADLALAVGPAVERLIDKGELEGAKLPLTRAVIRAVCGGGILDMPWQDFRR